MKVTRRNFLIGLSSVGALALLPLPKVIKTVKKIFIPPELTHISAIANGEVKIFDQPGEHDLPENLLKTELTISRQVIIPTMRVNDRYIPPLFGLSDYELNVTVQVMNQDLLNRLWDFEPFNVSVKTGQGTYLRGSFIPTSFTHEGT